ncbi:MAG: hypothetical protein JXR50_01330, partial [Prolixibacteraceae bacterium]|nr:hypothetical protein [Prolixibacteraceae bacterium]MBN2648363.1 hypothetical protein [Prolixibacteraceae bacterium]
MSEPLSQYRHYAELARQKARKLSKQLHLLSLLRLFSFVGMLLFFFLLWDKNIYVAVSISIALLVLFLFSVVRFQKTRLNKQYHEHLLTINLNEIDALDHRFSLFEPGKEFIDPSHINSYDLDLFGNDSVFQFLNRTVTVSGKQCLADMLRTPMTNIEAIENRQKYIAELSGDLEWRQAFLAKGMLYAGKTNELEIVESWAKQSYNLKLFRFFVPLKVFFYLLSVFAILYWIFYGNVAFVLLSALLQTALWVLNKNTIQKAYAHFGKSVQMLTRYEKLLTHIENAGWKSNEGAALIKSLHDKHRAASEISGLRSIISTFDNRNNFLIGIVLNLLFLLDLNSTYRLIKWHRRNCDNYMRWAKAIALADAAVSLANFAFNHPDYAYPVLHNNEFSIQASELGHPLIRPEKCVRNDFSFEHQTGVMIVTGANMSGKSTFLRTLGVNMVLGAAGAPVCARDMKYKPVAVYSNMRTSDSLSDDESYFFAELKRIKAILDEISSGRELFVILDEILKGTNSVDKYKGSQKLIERLLQQKAKVIIATHDLKLTEMAGDYPELIINKCFEIEIINNEMLFDYRLRHGVTSVMNATFLMKKM